MILFAALLGDLIDGVVGHIVGASMINAVGALYLSDYSYPKHRSLKPINGWTLKYESSMDALTKGTQDGLSMAVNIGQCCWC